LLPVANAKNPSNRELLKKGLTATDVKEIFFEKDDFLEEASKKGKKKGKSTFVATVYTREEKACAPTAFANHYGFSQENINGTGVSGDDKYLIHAVRKDSSGITYNNAGYIYDLTTREPINGIAVIPYDLNENGKIDENEHFYNNLDDLVNNLESVENQVVPIEHINISYPKIISQENNNLKLFLDYILTEGQKFNHEFGFLNLETEHLAKQKALLNRN
jgi:phosphate transport system substrate-binding protein